MFLSFYFMGEDIKLLKGERIKHRILRLYIPIFVWNIIYFGCKNIIFLICDKPEDIIGLNGLIEGLLFTHYPGLAAQLWFLFSQIVILVITCISLSYVDSNKCKNMVLVVMTAFALIVEYMGVNSELFENAVFAVKYPLGRVTECIPYAMFGILYSWNFKGKNTVTKYVLLVICIIIATISRLFILQPAGFGYGGFYLLFSSTSICILVLILPDFFIKGALRGG